MKFIKQISLYQLKTLKYQKKKKNTQTTIDTCKFNFFYYKYNILSMNFYSTKNKIKKYNKQFIKINNQKKIKIMETEIQSTQIKYQDKLETIQNLKNSNKKNVVKNIMNAFKNLQQTPNQKILQKQTIKQLAYIISMNLLQAHCLKQQKNSNDILILKNSTITLQDYQYYMKTMALYLNTFQKDQFTIGLKIVKLMIQQDIFLWWNLYYQALKILRLLIF
ncbi:hypothetical protein IMG5_168230 [Ichthyophthirius multifiliis]|uniref:Uncharacterized protein n=1 Tax=Ichthyophthirius multifiliis TaxID=5932 RepID=G0R120_ICHMU|nr:hypothetical protein IMG5_168230 [Ichthyophthirius multifiliis]EGR28787.1 hypothetical protein IMG5_168230 [Ichthyophthirius multifiliis]|eukprot:XP_004030023.1 hypothetical protein IMG5_168230 [Ichthyophthirius multifiliis]